MLLRMSKKKHLEEIFSQTYFFLRPSCSDRNGLLMEALAADDDPIPRADLFFDDESFDCVCVYPGSETVLNEAPNLRKIYLDFQF